MNQIKNVLILLFFLMTTTLFSQIDYSDSWEDFYSYNNVKDFYLNNNNIYAVCDNAIFIYNTNTLSYKKLSSVHGLSGETTSSFTYNNITNRIVIGYENGLIEIINPDGSIHVSDDIVRLNVTGSKRINHFIQHGTKLYISTAFAVLEYDIEHLSFGDTFYIGNQSSTENIHQIAILENTIYVATQHGLYTANLNNSNLIDFNNWTQPQGDLLGDFKSVKVFNNKIYTAKGKKLYEIINQNTLQEIRSYATNIVNLNASSTFLNVSLNTLSYTYNAQLIQVDFSQATAEVNFNLHNAYSVNNTTYLATKKYGILKKAFNQTEFEEIHPEGPLFNDVFSVEVKNNQAWVVYGGREFGTFNTLGTHKGFSHFNGEHWINTPYENEFYSDFVDVTFDPDNINHVFISSGRGGLFEVEDDIIINHYDYQNSGLEHRPESTVLNRTNVSGTVFDSQGKLWVTNAYVSDKVKKFDLSNSWQGYNFDDVIVNVEKTGLGDIHIDNNDTKWIESRRNGVLVMNKDGSKVKALNENVGTGSLPINVVKSLAIDKSNRIWIGTALGLVRFDNASNIFNLDQFNAKEIIIKLEGGTDENQGQILLGGQAITAIAVDGADNKWFGTISGGVLSTNPSGQKTLAIFNKDNSPLPSNQINKIQVDDTTGKVYFATAKGIVVYNNKVAPFGDHLDQTYAYPNPSTKENEFITIDGRHGTHLPKGTNVKVLDSAGYLVYETNILEGVEVKGGKAIWNKTNLAGRKVASGVYIIMLSLPDKSETSICKVAIIN